MGKKYLIAVYMLLLLVIALLITALVKSQQAMSLLEETAGAVFQRLDEVGTRLNMLIYHLNG